MDRSTARTAFALIAMLMATLAYADTLAPTLSPDRLIERQLTKNPTLVVLDVRSAAEYQAGHVPGAINVPHDQIEERLESLAPLRDKDVVVYCHSGRRAGLALDALTKHGFTRLEHLGGDMEGWTDAHRPIETSPADASAPPPR